MEEVNQPGIQEESVITVPVVPEEKRYEFQPVDESGRPLGGKQVILYTTQEDLARKLTDQNILLVRKLREQTIKQRLGISDKDEIPAEAPRFDVPLEFKARQLTPDERVKLSRDLLDPERCEEATSTMFEAAVGVKPEALRDTLTRLSQNELKLMAKVESDAFMENNNDYFPCQENFKTLTNWMIKNELAPVRENFQLAFDTLRTAGQDGRSLMLGKPEVIQPNISVIPTPEIPPVPTEPIEPTEPVIPEPVRQSVPLPTGFTKSQGGDTGVPPKQEKYTLEQINKMGSEEYKKRLLHEKGFAKLVQDLEAQASTNRKRN